jgi:hypothetical protein
VWEPKVKDLVAGGMIETKTEVIVDLKDEIGIVTRLGNVLAVVNFEEFKKSEGAHHLDAIRWTAFTTKPKYVKHWIAEA